MKRKTKIWLILVIAAAALSLILWIARPRSDIWQTDTILVEDASGKVQSTIENRGMIRRVLRQISKPTEEPWEDISDIPPTAQLEFITPEDGYGPIYYYQQYDICVTADGEWVSVPPDFYGYLCQSMDAS
jgi:hypothetical protein